MTIELALNILALLCASALVGLFIHITLEMRYLKRLFDRWDVEAWAARSRKGKVCGIFGCSNKPTTKCKHCLNWYCGEHKRVIEGPGHNPEAIKQFRALTKQ